MEQVWEPRKPVSLISCSHFLTCFKPQKLWQSTYSRSKGIFAGLTLEGAVVEQDNDSTRAIYGKNMKFRNILSGKASTPKSADAFMKAVANAGQQARVAEANEDKK